MGDRFTSADILLTTCLEWAIAYEVGVCDNAHPYLDRIRKDRPTSAARPPIFRRRPESRSGVRFEDSRIKLTADGACYFVVSWR